MVVPTSTFSFCGCEPLRNTAAERVWSAPASEFTPAALACAGIGDHIDAVAVFFERREDLGECEALAFVAPASTCPWWRRVEHRCSSGGSWKQPLCARSGVCAGTIDSSSGSATHTPVPRRNVRRSRCRFEINMKAPPSSLPISGASEMFRC